jgi:hypothetical protein
MWTNYLYCNKRFVKESSKSSSSRENALKTYITLTSLHSRPFIYAAAATDRCFSRMTRLR